MTEQPPSLDALNNLLSQVGGAGPPTLNRKGAGKPTGQAIGKPSFPREVSIEDIGTGKHTVFKPSDTYPYADPNYKGAHRSPTGRTRAAHATAYDPVADIGKTFGTTKINVRKASSVKAQGRSPSNPSWMQTQGSASYNYQGRHRIGAPLGPAFIFPDPRPITGKLSRTTKSSRGGKDTPNKGRIPLHMWIPGPSKHAGKLLGHLQRATGAE